MGNDNRKNQQKNEPERHVVIAFHGLDPRSSYPNATGAAGKTAS